MQSWPEMELLLRLVHVWFHSDRDFIKNNSRSRFNKHGVKKAGMYFCLYVHRLSVCI